MYAQQKPKARFIFKKMWLEHHNFKSVVTQVWNAPITGPPSVRLSEKLRRFRGVLKQWNWEVFGDIHTKIKSLQDQLTSFENQLQHNWQEEIEDRVHSVRNELEKCLVWEADMVYQKKRLHGFTNPIFFHQLVENRL